ncbi:hypothetical protein Tco_0322789 [Tanacetum coccineum]
MAFIRTSFASRCLPTNNQLRTSSNPRNWATIQDGKVKVQTVQGRQQQGYASSDVKNNATGLSFNRNGEPTQQVRQRWYDAIPVKKKATWHDSAPNLKGQGILHGLERRQCLLKQAFQTDGLDAFDSDCGEVPSANAILMAKLFTYDLDVLSEHIICQYVMSVVMHANVENVLSANNNCLEHDNLESTLLKKENDRLFELLISQDLMHTAVNSLAEIVGYQNMVKSYLDEYAECV